jgi:hypothetical protein
MADYTPTSNSFIKPYRSPWGSFPMLPLARESTGQTFRLGAMIEGDTSVSTAFARVQVMSTLSTNIAGVAGEAASSVQDQAISVYDANPMIEFQAVVKETIVSSLVGAARGLSFDSTLNIHYVNNNSSGADARVVITALHPNHPIGDSNGLVLFRFRREAVPTSSNSTTSLGVLAFHK